MKRFTTYEHIEASTRMTVIKKDGARVPYDREKIISGVLKACYKRPVSDEAVNKLVDEAEEEIFKNHDREIEAVEIGRIVADRIKRIDQVAYVRFASVYKQFRDIDDLLDEVRDLLKSGGPDTSGQGDLFSAQ
jgi:transcriptional repressor NrdR